jgi:NitT/TauT family transport system substrate-binding protein
MRLVQGGASAPRSVSISRRFRLPVAVLSAGLMMAGCGVLGGGSSGLGSSGNQTITVAAVPGVDNAPLYIARQDGLFRQHGLNVRITRYRSLKDEIQALSHGQADIAAGGYADFFYQESLGTLRLRLIADGYDAAPNVMQVLTLPTSSIKNPQDLQNQTVAIPPPGGIAKSSNLPYSMEMMATEAVLRNDGVGPTSITWVPMPESKMVSALGNHTNGVGAIVVTEPYIFEAESKLGAVSVLDSCSGVTSGLPLLGYFSLASYANGHAQAVHAFKAALLQAQADATMRGPVQAQLTSSKAMTTQDAALLTLGQYPTFLSVGQVQRVADLMYESGMIATRLAVRRLISG